MTTPPIYNPRDWYWIVGGDESRYWSSAVSDWVSTLPNGAGVTRIDTEQNLSEVLAIYGIKGPVALVPQSVPMWAVRTVLQNDDLFDQAQALVTASTDNALKNVWEYGNSADRNSTSIIALATALGLTSDDLDQMFIAANSISV